MENITCTKIYTFYNQTMYGVITISKRWENLNGDIIKATGTTYMRPRYASRVRLFAALNQADANNESFELGTIQKYTVQSPYKGLESPNRLVKDMQVNL